jgi:hypothetical protein
MEKTTMAIISWQLVQLVIIPATYGLVRYGPQSSFLDHVGYLGGFAILSSISLVVRLIWTRFLSPIWFSPLAKLPQPKVRLLALKISINMHLLSIGWQFIDGALVGTIQEWNSRDREMVSNFRHLRAFINFCNFAFNI